MEFARKIQSKKKEFLSFCRCLKMRGRRLCAMLLCASMVISGFPSMFFQAFASEGSEEYGYELVGESLCEAIIEAVSEGKTVDSEPDFKGEYAEQYNELFDADGTLYELKGLKTEKDRKRDKVLDLCVFVRIEDDIPLDDEYQISGSETVIFLLSSRSEDTLSAVISIDDIRTEMIEIMPASSVFRKAGPGSAAATEEVTESNDAVISSGIESAGAAGDDVSSTDSAAENSGSAYEESSMADSESTPGINTEPEDETMPGMSSEHDDLSVSESGAESEKESEAGSGITEEDPSEGTNEDAEEKDGETDGKDESESTVDSNSKDESDNKADSDSKDESGSKEDSVSKDESGSKEDSGSKDESGSKEDSDSKDESGSKEDSGSKDESGSKTDSDSKDESSSKDESDSKADSDSKENSNRKGSSGSSKSGSGSNSTDKSASLSIHRVGQLTSSIGDVDDTETEEAAEDVIEINDSEKDTDNTVEESESAVTTIASVSDALASEDVTDGTDEDKALTDTDTVDGELFPAVLLDDRKAAVAFAATAEDLGLDRFVTLEKQSVEVKIYTDASYEWRLADGTDITLSGMMPVDALAKAYPVDVEIDDAHILAAYDITIFNKNGKEFQPEDDVIEVLIENDAIYEALNEEHELTVYHMEDETDEPEEIAVIEPAPRRLQRLIFSAERFSIYIVTDEGYIDENGKEADVYTVNFYEYVYDEQSIDQAKIISSEKLVGEDKLLEPAVPEIDHHMFYGWYTTLQDKNYWNDHENIPGHQYDFDNTVADNLAGWGDYTPGADNVINLYSYYDLIYYVYYMTQEKTDTAGNPLESHNFYTEEYHEKGSVLDTSFADSLYQTSHLTVQEAVTSWYYYDAAGEKHNINDTDQLNGNGKFVINDNLKLYPDVSGVVWIYFDMGKEAGENTEALSPYYLTEDTEKIGDLPEPEIPGYTFSYWYINKTDNAGAVTEEQVGKDSNLKDLIDEETGYITLHAYWEPAKVSYTINIWRQKATDGQLGIDQKTVRSGETYDEYITYYDYAENIVVSEDESKFNTGEKPDISALLDKTDFGSVIYYDLSDNQQREEHPYNCFEYNEERTKNDLALKEMAADGSTVLNVFYDRVTVTWTFKSSTSSSAKVYGTLIGLYGTNVTPTNGSDPAGEMSSWPEYGKDSVWGYSNNTMIAGFETYYVLKNTSIPNSVTFTATTGGNKSATNYFYLEVTNEAAVLADTEKRAEAEALGIDYVKHINDKDYVYGTTHTHYWSGTEQRWIYFDDKFIGYTVCGYGQSEIEFVASHADGKVDIDDGSITYIYNDAEEYEIDIWSNNGTTLVNIGSYIYKYGADLSGLKLPEDLDPLEYGPNYYYHLSDTWYSDPSLTAEFTLPSSMPCNNLVIYAGWDLNEVKVTFETDVESNLKDILDVLYPDGVEIISNDEGGPWIYSVTIPAGTQLADGMDKGLIKETEGREDQHHFNFAGWLNLENNEVFNLNSHIYTDIILKAFWTEEETMYYIRYNINNESYIGESPVFGTAHDFSTFARIKEFTEVFANANDIASGFICWTTQKDGGGIAYYPCDEIIFADVETFPVYDGDETTGELLYYVYDLYARWTDTKETSLVLDYNYPEGYVPGDDKNPENATDIDTEVLNNLSTVSISDYSKLETTRITVGDLTYEFIGWAYNASTNTPAVPAAGSVAVDNLGLNPDGSEKNTLYAVWARVPVKEITYVNGYDYDGSFVSAGDFITYTIYYANYTNATAVITITDVLDRGLEYNISDPEGDYDEDSHTVTWTIPNVAPLKDDETYSGAVSLKVLVTDEAGEIIINKASVQVGDNPAIDTDPVDVPTTSRAAVDVYKYDSETEEPLGNAEFILTKTVKDESTQTETIYYAVFSESIEGSGEPEKMVYKFTGWVSDIDQATTLVSGKDGYIHIEDLEPGNYVLTETKAPDGFIMPAEGIELTVFKDGSIRYMGKDGYETYGPPSESGNDPGGGLPVVKIANTPGAQLPDTGGHGSLPFTLAGLLMTSGAALIYLILRRGKVRVEK